MRSHVFLTFMIWVFRKMMKFKSSAWTTSTNKKSGWIIVVRNSKSIAHNWNDGGDSTNDVIDTVVSAKYAISVLAKKSKSWKRLAPIIDLALYDDHIINGAFFEHQDSQFRSICDVGTDHGLLATSLAISNRFDKVVGVDVSLRAIQDGALKLQKQIDDYRRKNSVGSVPPEPLKVDFRLSDGLKNVSDGEADIVCVAGMGVHTMIDILKANADTPSNTQTLQLDHLRTQRLILQPTSSRPIHLYNLYSSLHDIGWSAKKEIIEYISPRWYITTSFERATLSEPNIPGFHLAMTTNIEARSRNDFSRWVSHHYKWIMSDSMKTGSMHFQNKQWIERFNNYSFSAEY